MDQVAIRDAGWLAAAANGHDLTYTVDEAEDLILSAASGQLDVPDIADWMAARLGPAS
jgi:death on curing protein